MKTFFTSDTHFDHKNIIKYTNRPFSSIDEMNQVMIENWNKKVTNKDNVYILGDFAFADREKTLSILNQLNGNKFMIRGNHDRILKHLEIRDKFIWVKDYYRLQLDDKTIILCHYPFAIWDKSHYGSINLYGHVHNTSGLFKLSENQYNVGVDINNFEPCTLEEIIKNNVDKHLTV